MFYEALIVGTVVVILGICVIYVLDKWDQERGSVFGSVFVYLLALRLWVYLYGLEVNILLLVGSP